MNLLNNKIKLIFICFVLLILVIVSIKPSGVSRFKKEVKELKSENKQIKQEIKKSYDIINSNAIIINKQNIQIDSIEKRNQDILRQLSKKEKELIYVKNRYSTLSNDSIAKLINEKL